MIPSLGRIVHVCLPKGHKNEGAHRAAIITSVYQDKNGKVTHDTPVDLTVFLNGTQEAGRYEDVPGLMFLTEVYPDEGGVKMGSFHEPERVEQTPRPKKELETASAGSAATAAATK